MSVVKYDEQMKEIDRELAMRRRLYPQWVERGSLKQSVADRQIKLMEDVRETVREARQRALMTGMDGKPIDGRQEPLFKHDPNVR